MLRRTIRAQPPGSILAPTRESLHSVIERALWLSRLQRLAELSRPTVKSYLEALQVARAVHLLPPFHGGGRREIVSRPKCYAFDTGFVTFEKGWHTIRDDDRGLLWEHLVLDALRVRHPDERIFYWCDKAQREVDFVIRRERDRLDALDPAPVEAFRARYPEGETFPAAPVVSAPYRVRRGGRVLRSARRATCPEEQRRRLKRR